MIGAIIGDIVGSRFEFNNHKDKDFELFTRDCFATDDTVMTLAVAKAIMDSEKISDENNYYQNLQKLAIIYMQDIGRKYPYCGYGSKFEHWIFSDNPSPYESYGNGAAMRISSVGFAFEDEEEALKISELITSVSHNHKEGIKGANATVISILMAKKRKEKKEIKKRIERDFYPLNFKIEDIREDYKFDETCQGTVPQAIKSFLESESFEDAIRIAISLGGDSDTIACIAGSISEAYYTIPKQIKEKALKYLPVDLLQIYQEWEEYIAKK